MDIKRAVSTLSSLSQATRLKAFRLILKHGRQGIAAGALSKKLRIPANTLSFHLRDLQQAKLIGFRKEGRFVIYFVQTGTMQALIEFLVADCCAVDKAACVDVDTAMNIMERALGNVPNRKNCC